MTRNPPATLIVAIRTEIPASMTTRFDSLDICKSAPITMMPLDVTHKAMTTAARTAAIRAIGSKTAVAVADMLEFYERFDEEKYGSDGGPLHDPCTIAWMLQPEMFSGRQCNVEIETGSDLTMGMTVIDWWQVTDRPHNAFVVGDLDADAFFRLITDRLAKLP